MSPLKHRGLFSRFAQATARAAGGPAGPEAGENVVKTKPARRPHRTRKA